MSGVRRLLEEDLELDKHSLDSHKKFINEQMEVVSYCYSYVVPSFLLSEVLWFDV